MVCLAHRCGLLHKVDQGVGTVDAHVAVTLDAPLVVEHDDGDGAIATNDGEHECEVSILIGVVESTHGFGPHLHTSGLFAFEVTHQIVGEDERCHAK